VADEGTITLSRNHSKTFNQTMSTGRVQPRLLPALQDASRQLPLVYQLATLAVGQSCSSHLRCCCCCCCSCCCCCYCSWRLTFPGNSLRVIKMAAIVPKTVFNGTEIAASINVSLVACRKSCSVTASMKGPIPLAKACKAAAAAGAGDKYSCRWS